MDFERKTEQREKKKEEQNRERENVRGGGCVVKKCKFLQSL